MLCRTMLIVIACFFSTISLADSISVTLKPTRGLAGTTSLNIHDDGNVTILVYKSTVEINEHTVTIEPNKKDELRALTLAALNSYLNQNSYAHVKIFKFTASFSHTIQGVTKSISSKRINEQAIKAIRLIIALNPDVDLKHIAEQI